MHREPSGRLTCVLVLSAAACGSSFSAAPADGGAPDHEARLHDGAPPKDGPEETSLMDGPAPPDVVHVDAGPCPGAGNFDTDPNHCGGCGHVCQSGPCTGGQCEIVTVVATLNNADSLAVDDADDVVVSELGTCCGTTCAGGQVNGYLRMVAGTVVYASGLSSSAYGIPVVTDGTQVYWATSASPGTVNGAALTGGPTTILTPFSATPGEWVALALDDRYLYAGLGGGTVFYTPRASATIKSWNSIAASAGMTSEDIAGLAATNVAGVHYVFWADRSDQAGTPNTGVISGAFMGSGGPTSVWTVSDRPGPTGIAASAFGVFWVEHDDADVRKASLKGKSKTVLDSLPGGLVPTRIAVDGSGEIYWTNQAGGGSGGTVMGLPHGATTPIVLASRLGNPLSIAVSPTKVYWVDTGALNGSNGTVQWTWR